MCSEGNGVMESSCFGGHVSEAIREEVSEELTFKAEVRWVWGG